MECAQCALRAGPGRSGRGRAGHDMEEEAPRGSACVDRIGQTLELHALLVEFAHKINQVLDAAAQTIQFPDDQGITLTEQFQCFGKSWPLGTAAADFVVEYLFASRLG